MDHNVLLSKIVANPTETTWSQAYSTLNLYIALSIKAGKPEESIASQGKEILEKLQREFFAVDQKTLENVKEAVDNTIREIKEGVDFSIILATITSSILYIVVGGEGSVVIKRDSQIGLIGEGEEGKTTTFSGKLKNNDIVILETSDFAKKVSVERLSSILDHLEVVEISENLAPLVHEGSNGSEAAIVLQYKKEVEETTEQNLEEEIKNPPPKKSTPFKNPVKALPKIPTNLSFITLKNIGGKIPMKGNKKLLILGGIIILVLILAGSLFFESKRQEKIKEEKKLSQVLAPSEKQFNEANELIGLNKSLALEEFEELKKKLEEERNNFPEKSTSRKKIDELIGQIEQKIGELGQNGNSTQILLLDGNSEEIKNIGLVGKRGSLFYVINKAEGQIAFLTGEGKIEKTVKTDAKKINFATLDNNNIYFLADSGLNKLTKSSSKTQRIATGISNSPSSTGGIDTFLDNIYVLNKSDKTIDKYGSPSFSKSSYFQESVKFENAPVSLSIDSSIWIVDEAGKIRKFTRGKEEKFEIRGLPKPIGKEATIVTGKDFANLYILDKTNRRLISISKNGDYVSQYSLRDLGSASSFTIDEPSKKGYIITNNNLYSFDL